MKRGGGKAIASAAPLGPGADPTPLLGPYPERVSATNLEPELTSFAHAGFVLLKLRSTLRPARSWRGRVLFTIAPPPDAAVVYLSARNWFS